MITVVDYGAGNLRSVTNALRQLAHESFVTYDPRRIAEARALVLPGVGSANDAMRQLQDLGLVEPIRAYVRSGRPFLGVCLGLQLLFSESSEGGGQPCLDLLPGRVRRLPGGVKVPHMGWNALRFRFRHPVVDGIPDGSYFYFVHSFFVDPADHSLVLAEVDYGLTFPAIVAAGNVVATQFHPEKSARWGLRIYENFARWALSPESRTASPAPAIKSAGPTGPRES